VVWIPKYRKSLLLGSGEKRFKELFYGIAEEHGFEIVATQSMPDHVHLICLVAPKWAPGKIVSIFKTITSKIIFEEFPQVNKNFWGGHLWSAGYYSASVEGKVTTDMVRRYMRHQRRVSFDWLPPTMV